jgi:hypothetical protein
MHNNDYRLVLGNTRLYFILQQVFLSVFAYPMLYSIPSFLNMIVHHYSDFTKPTYSQTNNWLSVRAQLHCSRYQALERRMAQETLIGCVELCNMKNSTALNFHLV